MDGKRLRTATTLLREPGSGVKHAAAPGRLLVVDLSTDPVFLVI